MKYHLGWIVVFSFIVVNAHAQKSDFSDTTLPPPHDQFQQERITPDDTHYPTDFRASILGQVSLQGTPPRDPGGGGSALLEYGRGLITGEIGFAYLTTRTNIAPTDSGNPNSKNAFRLMQGYAGIPIMLKVNYIERPQAALAFKVGVMPSASPKKTDQLNVGDSMGKMYNLSRSETFGIIGVTGAAPIDERSEFLLDIGYLRGFTNLDGNGARHELIEIGLGARFDL